MEEPCPRCLMSHVEDEDNCPNSALERVQKLPLFELPDSKPSPNKTRVIELLRCPINWSELAPGCPVVDELEYYWMVVATGCLKTGTGDFDGFSMQEPSPAVYLQSTEARDADLDYYERLTDSERENLREVLKAYAEAEGETLEVFFSPFF